MFRRNKCKATTKYTRTYGAQACLVVSLHQYNNWKSVGVGNFYFVVFGDAMISSLHCFLEKSHEEEGSIICFQVFAPPLGCLKRHCLYKAITANCFWWSMTSLMLPDSIEIIATGWNHLKKLDLQKREDVDSKAQFIGRPDIAYNVYWGF